jgi:hypothetical protein
MGTVPSPGSIVTLVAFCVVTVNVADCPRVSAGRSARSVMVGGATAGAAAAATGEGAAGGAAATLCLQANETSVSSSRSHVAGRDNRK